MLGNVFEILTVERSQKWGYHTFAAYIALNVYVDCDFTIYEENNRLVCEFDNAMDLRDIFCFEDDLGILFEMDLAVA
jgi:hypothetical protein